MDKKWVGHVGSEVVVNGLHSACRPAKMEYLCPETCTAKQNMFIMFVNSIELGRSGS